MTIEEAADSLQRRIGRPDWLNAIGVGEKDGRPALYVYLKTKDVPPADYVTEWMGYQVVWKVIGRVTIRMVS